jgi:hypothetical protein
MARSLEKDGKFRVGILSPARMLQVENASA